MSHRTAPRTAASLAALLLAAATVAGCSDLTSPNEDNEDLSELTQNPTPELVNAGVQGMLITNSAYMAAPNGYVVMLGILGRTAYNLDIADPRFVTSTLQTDLDPAGGAFGGNFWSQPYSNLQAGDRVLTGVEGLSSDEMSDAQKEGVRGFVKTFQALELLTIVSTRDTECDGTLGCPIEAPEDPSELAPALEREAVYDEIVDLLAEARGHLANAGDSFSFQLPLTFQGFDTPATFMEANWALEARVRVYRGSLDIGDGATAEFQAALDALENSFVDQGAPMDLGIANAYGSGSGDVQNSLFQPSTSPNARAHPSVRGQAEEGDARVAEKTRDINDRSFQEVSSDVGFDMYNSIDAPIPIIRNEELILLRAEANIGLGNLEDAEGDINFIREDVAGLDPIEFDGGTTQQEALITLLYEKRYSLLFEGGHWWIDTRRYGFDAPAGEGFRPAPEGGSGLLFVDPEPNDVLNSEFPIPINEQLARE
ncbi:MAG: RagB/SusD family nutrient uptake outer membrane protein [Gemmatimonadota bacterium]